MRVPQPTTRWVGAHPNNFTYGRPGGSIGQRETFHHIVGSGTAAENTFNNPTRQASAHYSVDWDGEIRQHVDVKNTAWSDGVWASNLMTISVEHAGGGGGIDYTDAMYEGAAHLRAWLIQTYGPLYSIRHRELKSTACPGGLNVERIVARANQIIAEWEAKSVQQQPEWLKNRSKVNEVKMYAQKAGLFIRNLNNPSEPADSRRFGLNQDFTITGTTSVNGKVYFITRSSFDATIANGIASDELAKTPYAPPAPVQPVPTKPDWADKFLVDDENRTMYVLRSTILIDLENGRPALKDGKEVWYEAGDIIENVSAHTIVEGETYQMTEYSFLQIKNGKPENANGIKSSDLSIDPLSAPEGTPANPGPETPGEEIPTENENDDDANNNEGEGTVPEQETPATPAVDEVTKKARVEASKTVGRNGLLLAISALLAALANWVLEAIAGINLPTDVVVGIGGVFYAIVLWLDNLLHVKSKQIETKVKGLIGF